MNDDAASDISTSGDKDQNSEPRLQGSNLPLSFPSHLDINSSVNNPAAVVSPLLQRDDNESLLVTATNDDSNINNTMVRCL